MYCFYKYEYQMHNMVTLILLNKNLPMSSHLCCSCLTLTYCLTIWIIGVTHLHLKTRKSSCVNARGIPTAAYQVLHLLTEVGYPPVQVWWRVPGVPGVPPIRVPPRQGTPLPPGPGSGTPPLPAPPPGPRSGMCGQTDGWMDGWIDRHVSKYYLPVVLRTRSVTNALAFGASGVWKTRCSLCERHETSKEVKFIPKKYGRLIRQKSTWIISFG